MSKLLLFLLVSSLIKHDSEQLDFQNYIPKNIFNTDPINVESLDAIPRILSKQLKINQNELKVSSKQEHSGILILNYNHIIGSINSTNARQKRIVENHYAKIVLKSNIITSYSSNFYNSFSYKIIDCRFINNKLLINSVLKQLEKLGPKIDHDESIRYVYVESSASILMPALKFQIFNDKGLKALVCVSQCDGKILLYVPFMNF
jgi:hypothetical protein